MNRIEKKLKNNEEFEIPLKLKKHIPRKLFKNKVLLYKGTYVDVVEVTVTIRMRNIIKTIPIEYLEIDKKEFLDFIGYKGDKE